jgi:hypothetical protein
MPATLRNVVKSMEYSDVQLGQTLGVHRSTAFRWRKAGMCCSDLEAAKAFAQNRKPKLNLPAVTGLAESIAPKPLAKVPETETAYDVRDRLQAQERSISAEISGLNSALEQARLSNNEGSAYKLLQSLKSAREEHRRQADSLLKAEGRIILLEKNRGDLVSVDACKTFVSKCIVPLTIWLRKLPDAGRNPEEKTLLTQLQEAGLAVMRTSAAEALNFNGKEALA